MSWDLILIMIRTKIFLIGSSLIAHKIYTRPHVNFLADLRAFFILQLTTVMSCLIVYHWLSVYTFCGSSLKCVVGMNLHLHHLIIFSRHGDEIVFYIIRNNFRLPKSRDYDTMTNLTIETFPILNKKGATKEESFVFYLLK